jgi:HNH endonuclease
VPEWVGLLALLEEWVFEHDGKAPRRPVDPILARDARCMAPGCTSRAQLEVHHLRYRSQGGSDAPDNLILLCAFHHRQGEHGGLASCRGKAPLDVVWRLGRGELAVWYQNERRLTTGVKLRAPSTPASFAR